MEKEWIEKHIDDMVQDIYKLSEDVYKRQAPYHVLSGVLHPDRNSSGNHVRIQALSLIHI